MLTKSGPKVLEFNARFGDPEAQVYLRRLESDLLELIEASVSGRLAQAELKWRPEPAICVVMAAGGYPGDYARGKPIHGLAEAESGPEIKIFHAGTAWSGAEIVTNGGRVLGVTACARNLEAARAAAYAGADKIRFDGAQFRRDIGGQALHAREIRQAPGL
jgi:phosphoribosylamine--glycine ligase